MLGSHVLFTSPHRRTNDFYPEVYTSSGKGIIVPPNGYVINLDLQPLFYLIYLTGLKLTGLYLVMGDIGCSDPISRGKNFFTPIFSGVS